MQRFALFYFLLFANVGAYVPWMPPLLEHRGLSAKAIAWALAVVSLSRAVLPPFWGILADRLPHKRSMLGGAAFAAGAALVALRLPGEPLTALLWLALYGFFLVPVMPLLETLTLEGLGEGRSRYGQVRLWGSFGFIATAWGLGLLVPRTGIEIVALAAGLPLILAGLATAGLPHAAPVARAELPKIHQLPWRALSPVLMAALLGQMSHGPYYAFFTLELAERDIPGWIIGALWVLGVAAEVVLMAFSPRVFAKLQLGSALRWALTLSALRWLVLALTDSLPLIGLSQLLHAASYALLHMTTLQLVDQITPKASRAFGQSVLSACAYGIGIGGGLALAGQLVGSIGYSGLYFAAALVCVFGLVFGFLAGGNHLPANH